MENLDFDFNYKVSKDLEIFIKFMNNFNINSIPKNIRDKSYVNYSDIFKCLNFSNRLQILDENANILDESLRNSNCSSTIYDVVNTLKTIYKLNEQQIRVKNKFNKIEVAHLDMLSKILAELALVLIPNKEKNIDIIDHEMMLAGYYHVAEKHYVDNEKREWTHLIYDPIEQQNINDQIRKKLDILYHCSPIENHENILSKGIIPMNEGRVYKYYQPRVYLHTCKPTDGPFIKMMKNIVSNRKRIDPNVSSVYILYMIDIDKIPKDIEFFEDPHGNNSVFTIKAIPKDAIWKFNEIDFETI